MCYENGASGSMPGNNGNLKTQQHWIQDGNDNVLAIPEQKFEYDQLNRLKRVYEGSSAQPAWQQQFGYDRYGNRTLSSGSLLFNSFEVETATNRLLAPGDSALSEVNRQMRYDEAGNLSKDSYTGQGQRTYDAANRMRQAWANGQWQEYTYSGDGQRVRRKVDGVETWQIYGLGGELLAEYAANAVSSAPQKEYGYRNGQLLISATVATAGWGTPPSFTPPAELVSGVEIKLEHLTELRSAVNQVRTHAGLSAATFTVDPNPERYVTPVKADHILQLRSALEEARSHLGLSTGGYAHPGLHATDPIYAVDFQELRNQVLSAWNNGGSGVDLRWLVADQLGTPRMIFDQSGSLANVSRHDYLPFGGDLLANGRSTSLGYGATDGARQKFTSKERDNETGLDCFGPRYFSSLQGRFTSVDTLMASAEGDDPQTWNRYAYVTNNPLGFTDPTGERRNPVTGRRGINPVPANGTLGGVRSNRNNPHVGEWGMTRNGGTRAHWGTDITAPIGTDLVAMESGTVTYVEANDVGDGGRRIHVTMADGTVYKYFHLSAISQGIAVNSAVDEGQVIAVSGNSGNAGGLTANNEDHVHVSIIGAGGAGNLNPVTWLNDPNAGVPVDVVGTTGTPPTTPVTVAAGTANEQTINGPTGTVTVRQQPIPAGQPHVHPPPRR